MGLGITELIIILIIIVLLFGTKKLRTLGADLGGALKSFQGAMKEVDEDEQKQVTSDDDIVDKKNSTEKTGDQ